jgi:hypothetical protein
MADVPNPEKVQILNINGEHHVRAGGQTLQIMNTICGISLEDNDYDKISKKKGKETPVGELVKCEDCRKLMKDSIRKHVSDNIVEEVLEKESLK